MSTYTAYSVDTGEITLVIMAPTQASAEMELSAGEALVELVADGQLHWIDPATGARMDRQAMAPSLDISEGEVTISGLPDPCEVRCLNEVEQVAGGSITIEFDEPGAYPVEVRARPQYLDHALEVEIP